MADISRLPSLYEIEDVAEYLGKSVCTIRRYVKCGELECIRIGNKLKFTDEQELIEQLDKLSKASRSEALSELIRLFKDLH